MSLVTVLGDVATTTTLAMAAGWPDGRATVLEADPNGGSVAAWLDIPYSPSLTDVVAALPDERGTLARAFGRLTPSGLRVVPAPLRAVEAARAVAAADELISWAATDARSGDISTVLVDAGRLHPARRAPAAVRHADALVVVHMQRPESPRASAARLERAAELATWLREVAATGGQAEFVLAVVGDAPFAPRDIAAHLGVDGAAMLVELPVDRLAAAALAGRAGVSARRLARLPLMRAAARLAERVADLTSPARQGIPA